MDLIKESQYRAELISVYRRLDMADAYLADQAALLKECREVVEFSKTAKCLDSTGIAALVYKAAALLPKLEAIKGKT